jgi:hypothetical protein
MLHAARSPTLCFFFFIKLKRFFFFIELKRFFFFIQLKRFFFFIRLKRCAKPSTC